MAKVLKLEAPYFQAWKKYKWPEGTWGLGISVRFLNAAVEAGQDVVVEYQTKQRKYVWFCETEKLRVFAMEHYPEFIAGQTKLMVFPVTMFTEEQEHAAPPSQPLEQVTGIAREITHKITETTNQKLCFITLVDGIKEYRCVITPRLYEEYVATKPIYLGGSYTFTTKKAVSRSGKTFLQVMSAVL